ncbi:MAG: hypothetical protein WAP03_25455 [Methylorubrum rhodinum]|uniref:hypothetical protein n=1 Tax=Methylorubrum rhodinum TaxID=29428 RepID=UPI003BB0AE72
MSQRRGFSWRYALAAMRADRAVPPAIREERLRSVGVKLSAWRGRSGRRYVARVHPIEVDALDPASEAVLIAVRRDAQGRGVIVAVTHELPRPVWFSCARSFGATELHSYGLATDAAGRLSVAEDLTA